MTTGNINTADSIASLLQERFRNIEGRGSLVNEATTISLLIQPTLEALGYPATYRMPEHGEGRNRLDDSCYLMPVTNNPGYAASEPRVGSWREKADRLEQVDSPCQQA